MVRRTRTKAAAVQMQAIWGRPLENTARAIDGIRCAAAAGADLVVLPECALNGYDLTRIRQGAPEALPYPSIIFDQIARASAEHHLTIVVTDLERTANGLYDSAFIFQAGALMTRHRKLVPTPAERAAGIMSGTEPAIPVALESGLRAAPMICFEYAFPQIAHRLKMDGADVLTLSAAIRKGFDHLPPVRIRARAQDNGCYLVAAHAIGADLCGVSMIVNPRGEIVARAQAGSFDVVVADLDPTLIHTERVHAAPNDHDHSRVDSILSHLHPRREDLALNDPT